jgi:hypothetical protein
MPEPGQPHDTLRAMLTRREAVARASLAGLGALIAAAAPFADPARAGILPPLPVGVPPLPGAGSAPTAGTPVADATLQAFADTILPGRRADTTDLGHGIDPLAIAGVDSRPGAVEADALALYHHPEVGFDALEPAFLADLTARAAQHGADFLHLGFTDRVQACLSGLDYANPSRVLWEAAAAVPFTAFCAAALIPNATAARASGYRVMGLPGVAPGGYRGFSYRRRLSHERTRTGSLP